MERKTLKRHSQNSNSTGPPPWIELPRDVTASILHRLGAVEILKSAQRVCTTWRSVCKDPLMWRVIEIKNSGDLVEMPCDLHIMCCHAVDRSQGQLIDINIEYFCQSGLLLYISERCSKLRHLRIASTYGLTRGLIEAVKRFPQLEELHILFISSFLVRYAGATDRPGPNLNWFTFNEFGDRFSLEENNNYALAVARNMPCLRHLRNFENGLMDERLRAILDGCPLLESLGLRWCCNVDLEGDLERRRSRRLEVLKRISDSIDVDHE